MRSAGVWEMNEWGVDAAGGYGEWQDVDRELRSIARQQSGLDAELMRVLREAERVRLWQHLGCVSMMEYLERVFGYSPRVAQERLRTARKLEELPELAAALEEHELPFSAVRELTRIATQSTDATWREAARGKSLREIEEMVSGLAEGDLPTSRKKPELQVSRLSYDRVPPSTRARERQLRQLIDAERGERLDDAAFIATVFEIAIDAMARGYAEPNVEADGEYGAVTSANAEDGAVTGVKEEDRGAAGVKEEDRGAAGVNEKDRSAMGVNEKDRAASNAAIRPSLGATGVAGRAKFQVVVYQCSSCSAGKQLGAGVQFDIDVADVERAHCDAEHVSALAPGRVTQDIPAKVRRFVELRDGNRCRIPGCRSTRCLELHHIEHREHGGGHEPENIVSICGGHHDAHHRDRLWIGGTSTNLIVRRIDEPRIANANVTPAGTPVAGAAARSMGSGAPARSVDDETRKTACLALTTLGWKPKIAGAAVDSALAELGAGLGLDSLIRAALQHCR
jgi:hypothetical protein